jgi:hypothetical protein
VKLRLKPTSYPVDPPSRIGLRQSFTVDVGTDANTGVFLAEYHHRPSRQGGSDDAHLGHPIPSPALFRPMHDRFVNAVKAFAAAGAAPLIEFESGQDKDAIVATHRARFLGNDGVVVIGVPQEKARAFKAHKRSGPQGGVTFDFTRQSVAVNHYYFYVQGPEWGPAFVKIGTYLPYPIKICLMGTNG